ncbi:signal peptide peptidase SppA [Pseudoduganella sp. GCM10020061]|uniref:signal peptide peptidase SppA n=1 Tax=Pseudoduganella sp. GCM10020061 TaxID=3317345 RepID=UPI003642FA97
MKFKPFSAMRRGLGAFWRGVDATRRTFFNLLFLLLAVFVLWAIFGGGVKPLGEKTALVVELRGDLLEQTRGRPSEHLIEGLAGGEVKRSMQLRDVLTVLNAAAKDPQISSVVLITDELDYAGLAVIGEVARAIDRVKAAGKPVIAWGGSFTQRQYGIASHASEIYTHPMGGVMLEGFGGYRNYYGEGLNKLGVTVNLMKVGAYKSAAEPYIGNGPSQASREADSYLYNALWANYTADVEKQRKLPAGAVMQLIDNLPQRLKDRGGDLARVTLDSKLVDGLKTRDEIRTMMIKRGVADDGGDSFRQVSFSDYLERNRPKLFGEGVAVIVASGTIRDGSAGPGTIGGISTSNLIRAAREDDQIKAVVLRVDSPGGSAFASELIRRELELTRAAGKPVVISMSNLAASGGYWISMAADEVIADANTITGSIGVFALVPTAEKVGEKLGIRADGVTTTWVAGAFDPLRPIDPRLVEVVQSSVENIYTRFTRSAAQARKTTPAKIDEVGQGRVWTGQQALDRGLVDRIGSFGDAIDSAAKRAKLSGDYRVAYIERESSSLDRLLQFFGASASQALAVQVKLGLLDALPADVAGEVAADMEFLKQSAVRGAPFNAVVHCMCTSP